MLSQILSLYNKGGLFQVKSGVTGRPAEIKFPMQKPFIHGCIISVPLPLCTMGIGPPSSPYWHRMETNRGEVCLLKLLCSSGLFPPLSLLFTHYICTRVIRRNFIPWQSLFFKWLHKKIPQCQHKQYILMIRITTEIWIELAFLVIIFLFLPFPDPSLRPAN